MIDPQSPMDYPVKWRGNAQKRKGFIERQLANVYRERKYLDMSQKCKETAAEEEREPVKGAARNEHLTQGSLYFLDYSLRSALL